MPSKHKPGWYSSPISCADVGLFTVREGIVAEGVRGDSKGRSFDERIGCACGFRFGDGGRGFGGSTSMLRIRAPPQLSQRLPHARGRGAHSLVRRAGLLLFSKSAKSSPSSNTFSEPCRSKTFPSQRVSSTCGWSTFTSNTFSLPSHDVRFGKCRRRCGRGRRHRARRRGCSVRIRHTGPWYRCC